MAGLLGRFDRIVGKIAIILVLGSLVAIPAGAWYYETRTIPSRYPPGAKVFTLVANARLGMWTMQRVTGLNYWRNGIQPVREIAVNKGDLVILRLTSSDVVHGFEIPKLGIKAGQVRAGHINEVSFVAEEPGTYTFVCAHFCSPAHPAMFGNLVVRK